jgi:hypothetical protein
MSECVCVRERERETAVSRPIKQLFSCSTQTVARTQIADARSLLSSLQRKDGRTATLTSLNPVIILHYADACLDYSLPAYDAV